MVVKALLDAGADPLVRDGFEDDAIAYAIKKKQPQMAEMMARKAGRLDVSASPHLSLR